MITTEIKGYFETVKGINWISGHAIKRLLENGPNPMFYMGLKSRPSIIYDVAYSPEEATMIGEAVVKGMRLESRKEIGFGFLSKTTASSLYYVVQKNYPKPNKTQIYKIEIPYTEGHDKTFEEWCNYVHQRPPQGEKETLEWYQEWKSAGN